MVTLVNIMVMNRWLRSFSSQVNQPPHSWDKAISEYDLETPRPRSWVWSKGNVIQLAQYYINSLHFHFTWIRLTIPEIELFRNLTMKHSRSWVNVPQVQGHILYPVSKTMHFLIVSHQSDQQFMRYGQNSVWPWKNTSQIFKENLLELLQHLISQ